MREQLDELQQHAGIPDHTTRRSHPLQHLSEPCLAASVRTLFDVRKRVRLQLCVGRPPQLLNEAVQIAASNQGNTCWSWAPRSVSVLGICSSVATFPATPTQKSPDSPVTVTYDIWLASDNDGI